MALRAAIERRLQEDQSRQEMAARLRARVRAQFSVDAMTTAVLTAYGETLQQRMVKK
jgi:hypothetical protein